MIYAGPALPGQPASPGATASTLPHLPKYRSAMGSDLVPTKARCTRPGQDNPMALAKCFETMCPRHQPANYSEHMARHATDSI